MPKFLATALKGTVDKVVDGMANKSVPQELQAQIKRDHGAEFGNVSNAVRDAFVGGVVKNRGEDDGAGTGGWLQAIAKAMGKTLGDKASQMVKLSSELQGLTGKTGNATKDAENAAKFNEKTTEFQATGQEYSLLNSVFTNAIKSIGEAISTMARKQ